MTQAVSATRSCGEFFSWYEFEEIDAKVSHVKYKHPLFERDLIIAVHNNDCKSYMKKEAQRRIKKLID